MAAPCLASRFSRKKFSMASLCFVPPSWCRMDGLLSCIQTLQYLQKCLGVLCKWVWWVGWLNGLNGWDDGLRKGVGVRTTYVPSSTPTWLPWGCVRAGMQQQVVVVRVAVARGPLAAGSPVNE